MNWPRSARSCASKFGRHPCVTHPGLPMISWPSFAQPGKRKRWREGGPALDSLLPSRSESSQSKSPSPILGAKVMWVISLPHWWEFVIRAVVVYLFLLVLLRLTGKRQVGQMAPFDLVLLLVLSNAVQNSMNGGDNSITGGMILA